MLIGYSELTTTGKQAREDAWPTLPPGAISWHRKEHARKQQKRMRQHKGKKRENKKMPNLVYSKDKN